MARIHIIYNSLSEKELSLRDLSYELMRQGNQVSIFFTTEHGTAEIEARARCDARDVDLLLAFGGDGTLNQVINGIMKSEQALPFSVFPGGTANDFASHLQLPSDEMDFAKMIQQGRPHAIDIGKANDVYFINVLACGILSSIAHNTDPGLKARIGYFAYYLEAIRQLSSGALKEQSICLESEQFKYCGNYILLLVNNSTTTGGFRNLTPGANIRDGLFNCLLIKRGPIGQIVELLIELVNGNHVDHELVEYFESSALRVESQDEMDIDGERLNVQHVDIQVLPGALNMVF